MHPDQKTLDALNAPKAFQEYPKAMFHPDGRYQEVQSKSEEEAQESAWQLTLVDALELKAAREKIAAKPALEASDDSDTVKAKGKAK
jgi:hypothetical protein